MKVIDLLNIWVKDRNKLPEKIKIDNKVFEYDEKYNLYKTPDKDCYLIQNYLNCVERLDREVEAIEKNKEIERINYLKWKPDKKTLKLSLWMFILIICDKINELVRAVNKLNKESEEK